MKIFLMLMLIFSVSATFAQTKKFRWSDDLCEYEGTYNARKYTEAQLKNTLELLWSNNARVNTNATVRKYEHLKTLSIADLDKEYETKSNRLKHLEIVKSAYWENVREQQLTELTQSFNVARATMLAYEKPEWLKEVPFARACATKYADALTKGGDDLMAVWLTVNEESRRRNADPERIRKIFETERDSPDREKYALVEVMTFGWWNCAVGLIERGDDFTQNMTEYKKLFTKNRTVECDEP